MVSLGCSDLKISCHLLTIISGEAIHDPASNSFVDDKLFGNQVSHVLKSLPLLLPYLIPESNIFLRIQAATQLYEADLNRLPCLQLVTFLLLE